MGDARGSGRASGLRGLDRCSRHLPGPWPPQNRPVPAPWRRSRPGCVSPGSPGVGRVCTAGLAPSHGGPAGLWGGARGAVVTWRLPCAGARDAPAPSPSPRRAWVGPVCVPPRWAPLGAGQRHVGPGAAAFLVQTPEARGRPVTARPSACKTMGGAGVGQTTAASHRRGAGLPLARPPSRISWRSTKAVRRHGASWRSLSAFARPRASPDRFLVHGGDRHGGEGPCAGQAGQVHRVSAGRVGSAHRPLWAGVRGRPPRRQRLGAAETARARSPRDQPHRSRGGVGRAMASCGCVERWHPAVASGAQSGDRGAMRVGARRHGPRSLVERHADQECARLG